MKTGAYQKINISDKDWYIIAFNDFEGDNDKVMSREEYLHGDFYKYENYIIWFLVSSIILLAVILFLSSFKIIKLERRLLFSFSVITFLSVCAIYAFFTSLSIRELKNHFKENYISQNHFAENVIYAKIESVFNLMEKNLEHASEKLHGLECSEDERCTQILTDAFNKSNDMVCAIYRISKEGVIESMYPEEDGVIGSYIGDQDHIIKIEKDRKTALSDVFDAPKGFRAITIHYPIITEDEYYGTIAFLVKIDKSFESIISHPQNNNKIFLLDGVGNIISSSEKENTGRNVFNDEKYSLVMNKIKKSIDSYKSGFREFSYKDKNIILSYTPIFVKGNSWFIVTESIEEDAYHGLNRTLDNVWMFTFVILAALAVFAFFFNWFLTKALRNEVNSRTNDIKRKTDFIAEQLKKEEENNREKEELLKKQKKIEKNLENKIIEMEKFQKLVVDRELKMVELKEELSKAKNTPKGKRKKQSI